MNAYVRFAKSNELQLVQLKSGKEKKGIYTYKESIIFTRNSKSLWINSTE